MLPVGGQVNRGARSRRVDRGLGVVIVVLVVLLLLVLAVPIIL